MFQKLRIRSISLQEYVKKENPQTHHYQCVAGSFFVVLLQNIRYNKEFYKKHLFIQS